MPEARIAGLPRGARPSSPGRGLPTHLTATRCMTAPPQAASATENCSADVLCGERSDTLIEVDLAPYQDGGRPVRRPADPASIALDAAFTPCSTTSSCGRTKRYAYLPVRFAAPAGTERSCGSARARLVIDRETQRPVNLGRRHPLRQRRPLTSRADRWDVQCPWSLERRTQDSVFFQQQSVRLSRHGSASGMRACAMGAALDQLRAQAAPESLSVSGGVRPFTGVPEPARPVSARRRSCPLPARPPCRCS